MKKKLLALIAAALLALAMVTPTLAGAKPQSVPQSNHGGGGALTGNEGQPGHHGGPQHNP